MAGNLHSGTMHPLVTVTDQDAYSGDTASTGQPDPSKAMALDIRMGYAAVGTLHHKIIVAGVCNDSSITYTSIGFDCTLGGLIFPSRTTTQRGNIPTPAAGTVIYNSSTNKLNFYNGSAWEAVTSA